MFEGNEYDFFDCSNYTFVATGAGPVTGPVGLLVDNLIYKGLYPFQ